MNYIALDFAILLALGVLTLVYIGSVLRSVQTTIQTELHDVSVSLDRMDVSDYSAIAIGRLTTILERLVEYSPGDVGALRMRDVARAEVYSKHLGKKLRTKSLRQGGHHEHQIR